MNKLHIIYIPFTGVGLHGGYRGDEWFKERIQIFKDYTLKSLQAQTNKNFMVLFSFRPEELHNKLLLDLFNSMGESGIEFKFSFEGLLYYDDKFAPGWTRFLNLLRVGRDFLRGKWSVKALLEVFHDKNKTLPQRLQRVLSAWGNVSDIDSVYFTRLDSDDMLALDAVEVIQNEEPFQGALTMGDGFIYNTETQHLGCWMPDKNPPFHTIIFPAVHFFDTELHMDYMKGFRSHEDIPSIFTTKSLGEGLYCVTVHGTKNHISTIWNHPFRKGSVKVDRLTGFGL